MRCMIWPHGLVAHLGAAVRRHRQHEDHASSKLIRSFPAALQGVECVLEARLSSWRLVGSAVACVVSVWCRVSFESREWVRALAGGESRQVSQRYLGTALWWAGAEPKAPSSAERSESPLSHMCSPRAWCSTGIPFGCDAQFDLGSPTSPACTVNVSLRLPPSRRIPSAGYSSKTAWHQTAASASSSSRRLSRSWRRRARRPGPCLAGVSSSA